ncbi:LysR family transcriptional regulator [Fusobacterium perfoetens]|uniref:LysR family transcriptional regulator n=1 Tax=Fusobacterium perfoetens TaxID=852 RepID=UPI001F424C6D|nr:LysR family transcriptional regulator [Fusobacterium perfoetens]MCF2613296.1 LysR family transcriptional regulator [Fusobacterium perfoetens]
MLDYRILTFLKLCETMNYRITAEELNMTQPAVTQHIHYLEEEYECKLFIYNRKKLEKTNQAILLEEYARSAYYNEIYLKRKIKSENKIKINIGATKTIGEFVIGEKIKKLVKNEKYDISLTIDNTEKLIKLMELNKLDFILVEGIFNKDKYGYRLYKKDEFIGICSKNHKFNGKSIKFEELFEEDIIIREEGSGTRGIFEQFLSENSFSLEFFKKKITINNFNLIKELVSANCGISFVYNSVVNKNDDIGKFYFKNKIEREFNYLYLKNTAAKELVDFFDKLEGVKSFL